MDSSYEPESMSANRPQRRTKNAFANVSDFDYSEAYNPIPSSSRSGLAGSAGPPPKLKVKFDKSAAVNATTGLVYNAKKYDRELDSDPDEPLVVEEQFILRLPSEARHSAMVEEISELIKNRKVGSSKSAKQPWIRFRDSRRGIFGFGKPDDTRNSHVFRTKLVDLPCIIESHKTLDHGKHLFKVADITQMLVVESELQSGIDPNKIEDRDIDIEEYMYPHGLTPPLQHVRKRRFRKRTNKRTIESVERAVEDLLLKDSRAARTEYELVDPNDLMDDEPEMQTPGPANDAFTPLPVNDDQGEMADLTEDEDETMPFHQTNGQPFGYTNNANTPMSFNNDSEMGQEDQDDIDDDLAAELARGILPGEGDNENSDDSASDHGETQAADGGAKSDSDDLFGSGGEDSDAGAEGGGGDAESRARIRMLNEEIRALEKSVKDRTVDIGRAQNPIIKARFETNLRNATSALEQKRSQLATILAGPAENADDGGEEDGVGETMAE